MPVTMMRLNLVKGLGPVLQIAEGWTVEIDPEIHQKLNMRTDPTWPTTWFVPRLCDKPAFKDVYSVMNNWGANHGACLYAPHPCMYAQRRRRPDLPPSRMERFRYGQRGCRLQSLYNLRSYL